ncbi:MAG TPA: malectin domain-containing carbohydrate-binding protein, partial [Polyangiaceae bacterium]|nr:malectin domain-containing carbohydrate-binding protein [Polyangiaceae bacterium]
ATIRDAGGATVSSNVNVTVNQKLTSISVTPTSASIVTGGSQSFAASAKDQFATAMSPQPTIAWSVSGGGTINSSGLFSAGSSGGGPFTVTAASGGVSGTASVTVTSGSTGSPVYQINIGGGALSPFAGDQFASGGSTWTEAVTVSTAGVTNAAPMGVYQSERYGNFSYTFGSLSAGASYTVRLHFAENKWTSVGARVFNVLVNGSQVLTNFDIFASAGPKTALVRDFTTTASGSGQITVQYVTITDNAKACGIEIISNGGGSNPAPTVATAAAANPNPTVSTTTALSVLGADDGGEANLSYTWATVGTPPAAVSFSNNGTNAAKNTTATFSKAGSYTLGATIRDAGGATVSSNVNVTVNQKLSSISVTPASASVVTGGSQQFLATANDQFSAAMSPQPTITWSVSGGGTINSIGLFSAGGSSGGPFTVSAKNGTTTGNASVTVTNSAVTYTTDFNLTESPISEGGAWKQLGVDWTRAVTANGFAFGTQTGFNGFNDSYAYLSATYPANQSASAIIHLEPGITAKYQEVEILLRWSDSAHFSTGYECNLAFNGQYAFIGRWPGPLGTDPSQFTTIAQNGVPQGVHDGDVFQADIIGNVITSRLNGQVIASGTDNAITSGSPGIGFYAEGAAANQKFSFTHFSATGL